MAANAWTQDGARAADGAPMLGQTSGRWFVCIRGPARSNCSWSSSGRRPGSRTLDLGAPRGTRRLAYVLGAWPRLWLPGAFLRRRRGGHQTIFQGEGYEQLVVDCIKYHHAGRPLRSGPPQSGWWKTTMGMPWACKSRLCSHGCKARMQSALALSVECGQG